MQFAFTQCSDITVQNILKFLNFWFLVIDKNTILPEL